MPYSVISASRMPENLVEVRAEDIALWTAMMNPMGLLKTKIVEKDSIK